MRDAKLKLSRESRTAIVRARARSRFSAAFASTPTTFGRPRRDACQGLDGVSRHAWAVEEPLRPRDWAGLAEVGTRTGLALVLDESATHPRDLAALVPGPRYVVNVRVSKLGGLLRTLAMIDAARTRGYAVIVGAQVGETSILARAGIAAARAAASSLIGFEAAFGTRLLARDATTPSLRFGYGGRVDLAGLGLLGSRFDADAGNRRRVLLAAAPNSRCGRGERDEAHAGIGIRLRLRQQCLHA